MPKQQDKPVYTPGYTAALKELANLAQTTPERLVAEFKDLSPETRFIKFKQKLALIQLISPQSRLAPVAVEKLTAFLIELNKTMEDAAAAVGQELAKIAALQDNNAKLESLKKLLLSDQVIAGCMNYFDMVIKSRYRNKNNEIEEVSQSNLHETVKSFKHVNSQGDYDPERKLIRDFMRLLFELFDLVLIQIGSKPVYMPNSDENEPGLWDPKRGIVLGDGGAHVP